MKARSIQSTPVIALLLRIVPLLLLALLVRESSGAVQPNNYSALDLYTLALPTGLHDIAFGLNPMGSGSVVGAWASSTPQGSEPHALWWNGVSVPVDLHSSGYTGTQVNGVGDGQQVGNGYGAAADGSTHALLWHGTNTPVDLNPPGFTSSDAWATDGLQQVGNGHSTSMSSLEFHALLWNGTNSVIDLHPASFDWSTAYGVKQGWQIGYGEKGGVHALLWHGTNAAVDLHPAGFTTSQGFGVGGGQQVGTGEGTITGNKFHALLWNGTNIATDLHPAGFKESYAYATDGSHQVGYGDLTGGFHALLWNGTNSATDLGAMLPASLSRSEALAIDSAGNIFGLAFDSGNNLHAVEWAIPEPAGLSLLAAGGLVLARRRPSGGLRQGRRRKGEKGSGGRKYLTSQAPALMDDLFDGHGSRNRCLGDLALAVREE